MLFYKEEYNDYKNKIKTYKYSDFLGTFESEDIKFFTNLSRHKNRRINNINAYSMIYGLYSSDYTNEYNPLLLPDMFYRGIFYKKVLYIAKKPLMGKNGQMSLILLL